MTNRTDRVAPVLGAAACAGTRRAKLVSSQHRGAVMKMVAVYLARAAELDALARRCDEAPLKKRFMDIADSYRLLAEERRQDINDKNADRKAPPQSD